MLCATRATLSRRSGLAQRVVDALVAGYDFALSNPSASAQDLERLVPGLDPKLVSAQLAGLLPAFQATNHRVGVLVPTHLAAWAGWEVRFGVVSRPPNVARAFNPSFAAGAPAGSTSSP